jgi:hypothetical protein
MNNLKKKRNGGKAENVGCVAQNKIVKITPNILTIK